MAEQARRVIVKPKKQNRYDFVKAVWGQKLLSWAKDQRVPFDRTDLDVLFQAIAKYDPTQKSSPPYQYLAWICRMIVQNEIRFEDIYKIRNDLELFDKFKDQRKIPQDKKDIGRLTSPQELMNLVAPYLSEITLNLNELSDEERERVLGGTIFLYNGEGGKILIPTTMHSAQFWGRGTKWCFSEEEKENNKFDRYHNEGPIVIYISDEEYFDEGVKRARQYKYAGNIDEDYLRNHSDTPVRYYYGDFVNIEGKFVKEKIPVSLQKIIIENGLLDFCFKFGAMEPSLFNDDCFTEDDYIEFLSKGFIQSILQIPKDKVTKNIVKAYVEYFDPDEQVKLGEMIGCVPRDELFSREEYLELAEVMIRKSPSCVDDILSDFDLTNKEDKELQILAFQSGWILSSHDWKAFTKIMGGAENLKNLLLETVESGTIGSVNKIPRYLFNEAEFDTFIKKALAKNGELIKGLPVSDVVKKFEWVKAAVEGDVPPLDYIYNLRHVIANPELFDLYHDCLNKAVCANPSIVNEMQVHGPNTFLEWLSLQEYYDLCIEAVNLDGKVFDPEWKHHFSSASYAALALTAAATSITILGKIDKQDSHFEEALDRSWNYFLTLDQEKQKQFAHVFASPDYSNPLTQEAVLDIYGLKQKAAEPKKPSRALTFIP